MAENYLEDLDEWMYIIRRLTENGIDIDELEQYHG